MDSFSASSLDLKRTLSKNRLLGLWRMMTGFRLVYVGAAPQHGHGHRVQDGHVLAARATLVDDVLGKTATLSCCR